MQNGNGTSKPKTANGNQSSGDGVLKRESSLVEEQYGKFAESGDSALSPVGIEMSENTSTETPRARVSSLPAILEDHKNETKWIRT